MSFAIIKFNIKQLLISHFFFSTRVQCDGNHCRNYILIGCAKTVLTQLEVRFYCHLFASCTRSPTAVLPFSSDGSKITRLCLYKKHHIDQLKGLPQADLRAEIKSSPIFTHQSHLRQLPRSWAFLQKYARCCR